MNLVNLGSDQVSSSFSFGLNLGRVAPGITPWDPHRSGSARHNAPFVTKPRSHRATPCVSMRSRVFNGSRSRDVVLLSLPHSVSSLPGAFATAVVPAHRPRRSKGRAAEPAGSEPSHAAPRPVSCPQGFEARELRLGENGENGENGDALRNTLAQMKLEVKYRPVPAELRRNTFRRPILCPACPVASSGPRKRATTS